MWQFLFFSSVFLIVVSFLKLNQRSRRHSESNLAKRLSTGNDFRFPVVGESSYQAEIAHAISQDADSLSVHLVPEDTNPYDHLAVKVVYRGTTIGYLSRGDARALRDAISSMGIRFSAVACRAKPFGGSPDKPTIGVWLNIDIPK